MKTTLALAPSVHACADNDELILLDLRANRYLGARRASRADGVAVAGLPAAASCIARASAEALIQRGVIIEGTREEAALDEGASIRRKAVLDRHARANASQCLSFARAGLWADLVVRTGELQRAAAWIRRAKTSEPRHAALGHALASAFMNLRPWYPARRVCLFDSLALMRFMLERRARADLVFAVRARPFAAHCWVEAGGEALNDFYDCHAAFTPILRL